MQDGTKRGEGAAEWLREHFKDNPAPEISLRWLRAVDYLRVSTDDQAQGYGISYTGKRTAEHIKTKGWDHVGTFADEGVSGCLPWREREDMSRLVGQTLRTPRPFDVVVVVVVVVVNEERAIGRAGRAFWPWVWDLEDLGIFVAIDKTLHRAWELIVREHRNRTQAAAALNLVGMFGPGGRPWTGDSLAQVLKGDPIQRGVRVFRNPASAGKRRGTQLGTDGRPWYGETVTIKLDRIFTKKEVRRLNAALERTSRASREGIAVHPLSTRLIGLCGSHYTGSLRAEEERGAWQEEAAAAEQRPSDLQTLARVAPDRLHEMAPPQQAEVLSLLDVRVTILGPVPPRIRRDDQVAGWFRSRERVVPDLSDDAWALAETALAPPRRGRPARPPRLAMEAILHKARTGCAWRNPPAEYGPWETVVGTWRRWQASGEWEQMLNLLADTPGTAVPEDRVLLPPLRVEGRLDPRLLIDTQEAPKSRLANRHMVGLTYVL
ncbi:transposase [Streptomyces scopuliridis]|uniref:transposase n=1 Tax=Streptomyces scopuliridis TaxID=452529 RepID=UPI0036BA6386